MSTGVNVRENLEKAVDVFERALASVLDWRDRRACSRCGGPEGRYGGEQGQGSASEMRPQPVTAAAPRPLQWPVGGGNPRR